MTVYLDIAVTGVQDWIFRSGDLRGVRGASSALSRATDKDRWTPAPGWEWNAEAGNVAGSVTLCRQAGPAAQAVEEVADDAIRLLRKSLPAAPLVARWGRFDSYAEFRSRGARVEVHQAFPSVVENPLGRTCQGCRQSVADAGTGDEGVPDDEGPLCADCAVRARHAPYAGAESAWALEAVWDRLRTRSGHSSKELRVPSDLSRLAALGGRSGKAVAGDAQTRLALICADGRP